MNKKLLPILLAFPLLAGCGTNVKKPAFKKVGDKVTFEQFKEGIEKAREENIFFKGDELPSFQVSLESKGVGQAVSKRGKQTLREAVTKSTMTINSKLDVKNGVSERKQVRDESVVLTTNLGSDSADESSKSTLVLQKLAKDNEEYAITVNEKAKYYIVSPANKISELNPYSKILEKDALTPFATVKALETTMLAEYQSASEEEKARYSFYQNKQVFTVEYVYEENNEEDKTSEKSTSKLQFDLSDNEKYTVMVYSESSSHEEVLETHMDEIKGDVFEEVTKNALTLKAQKKNVTVKPVKITDAFAEYNYNF